MLNLNKYFTIALSSAFPRAYLQWLPFAAKIRTILLIFTFISWVFFFSSLFCFFDMNYLRWQTNKHWELNQMLRGISTMEICKWHPHFWFCTLNSSVTIYQFQNAVIACNWQITLNTITLNEYKKKIIQRIVKGKKEKKEHSTDWVFHSSTTNISDRLARFYVCIYIYKRRRTIVITVLCK